MNQNNTKIRSECEVKSLANAAIEVIMKSRGISGYGQFHTANPEKKNPKPYNSINYADIHSMVKNPGTIAKEDAQWVIFSTVGGELGRKHDFQRDHGKFFNLWADLDDVENLTFLDVTSRVKTAIPDTYHIIYSSRSAREGLPNSRVLVPLSGVVPGRDYSMIQKILNDRLNASGLPPDRATERPGQLCYLPNRGEHYQYYINDGLLLDPYEEFKDEIIAEQARLKAEQEEREKCHRAAIQKAQERINTGQADPIDAFKQTYPVKLALERYGYIRRGNKYVSPLSESGKPGVKILDNKWFSHHSSDAVIGQPKASGSWGDAFDLFVHFEHDGNFNQAVKAAGEMFTTTDQATGQVISITKFNQREYMRQQNTAEQYFQGTQKETGDSESYEESISQAKNTLDQALSAQTDDPGALYADDALDAYNFLKKNAVDEAMRYRAAMSDIKNVLIGKLEQAAKARTNLKKYGDAGKPVIVIDYFNKKHAGVMCGAQFRILEEFRNNDGFPDVRISSVPDFFNRYSNKKMPDPSDSSRLIPAARFWMDSEDRRDFMGGIDFRPKGGRKDTYNLWRGFAVTPKPGSWELMKKHVYDILAAGNKSHGNYLLAWCANILQNPHKKNTTCPVLLSGQGTGKNTFVDAFGKILGQHFKTISNTSHLSGKFNAHMKACLLLFSNEAVWGGNKEGAGQIKGLITDDTIRIEEKGKDSYQVKNNLNLIISSNSDWAVPAEVGDRRYFVLKVSERMKDNTDYFNALHAEINNGGIAAMMHDLLAWDLNKIDLRKIERTEALFDQIMQGLDSLNAYWFHRLKDGYLLPTLYDDYGNMTREPHKWEQPVISSVQYNDFLDYCA